MVVSSFIFADRVTIFFRSGPLYLILRLNFGAVHLSVTEMLVFPNSVVRSMVFGRVSSL